MRVMVILDGESELLEVVGALHTTSRFARRLDGGQKQTNKNTDDSDDDEQFDKRKTAIRLRHENKTP